MKHAVLGSGNLGLDLCLSLEKRHQDVRLFGKTNPISFGHYTNWNYYMDGVEELRDGEFDVIWCCVGAGSVDVCNSKPDYAIDLHVKLPVQLMKAEYLKNAKKIFFSTDYCASENELYKMDPEVQCDVPKSFYAQTKHWMEEAVRRFPNASAVRIGSLYGNHLPRKCLPYKFHNIHSQGEIVEVYKNRITPTPSWWVSDVLTKYLDLLFGFDAYPIHHLAPKGNCSLYSFAKLCLGEDVEINKSEFLDPNRPNSSLLGCSLPIRNIPDFLTLWEDERNGFKIQTKPGLAWRQTEYFEGV